ncbi:MAG: glucose 1-dehydrogenase [Chloroflexi bacterium]|nr:glucose 1-dehydrogenase [Chloroflexota bacterium]
MRLEGKVAFISGGARGMGAAEARLFAKEGAKVVMGDVLEAEGKQVEAEINETGGEALFISMDVAKEDDWQRAIDATVARFGKLNVLVNNAGIVDRSSLEETSEEIWDRVMDVNAKGVFLGTKMVIPEMRKAGGGSIINISSISGMVSVGFPAYNASKGAVRVFTKNVAVEYARENIRVNSIHPGAIWTPMSLYHTTRTREERARTIPMGRVGEPKEVAYGVLFLASDESSYMTGSELVIDGGVTAE